jgi:uncharacterized membrane protein YeiH
MNGQVTERVRCVGVNADVGGPNRGAIEPGSVPPQVLCFRCRTVTVFGEQRVLTISRVGQSHQAITHITSSSRTTVVAVEQSMLLLILDLAGISVFAAAGALAGMAKRLDLFGVIVIAAASSLGGGLVRDVLLGDTPPVALQDWRYLVAPVPAALVVFFRASGVKRLRKALLVLDAFGLGLFAAAGAEKASRVPLGVLAVVGIGVLTAVGGGVIRDVLLREIPVILRKEIYATAALLGALIVALGNKFEFRRTPVAIVAIVAVALMRVLSLRRGWNMIVAEPDPTLSV